MNITECLFHKRAYKSVKTKNITPAEIENFIIYCERYLLNQAEATKQIKCIDNSSIIPIYRFRLNDSDRIIFSHDESKIIFFDIGNHDIYKNLDFINYTKYYSESEDIPFYSFRREDLEKIITTQFPEKYYKLSSEQEDTLIKGVLNYVSENIIINGAPGSGKTLVINNIAYNILRSYCEESERQEKPFYFITYNTSLKENFRDFILRMAEEDKFHHEDTTKKVIKLSRELSFTFEEFIRKITGKESEGYITSKETEEILREILLTSKDHELLKCSKLSYLYFNELSRIIFTLGDEKETEKYITGLDKKGLNIREFMDEIEILRKRYLKKVAAQNKKPWNLFVKNVKENAKKISENLKTNLVIFDEMQDLSQDEFNVFHALSMAKEDLRFISSYDINQNISAHPTPDKNILNRFGGEKSEVRFINNYRNTENIKKLSSCFGETTESSNNGFSENPKIKIIIGETIECLKQLEKRINEPTAILAMNNTYKKAIEIIGRNNENITIYNEEEIKGLEFSNMVIMNFMEPESSRKEINEIDYKKWYVGITRAKSNLLLHFRTEEEVKKFKEIVKGKEEIFIKYEKYAEGIEEFIKSLEPEDEEEKNKRLIKLSETLINRYNEEWDFTALVKAIEILEKSRNINYLTSLLEEKAEEKSEYIYEKLFKLYAIELEDMIKAREYAGSIDVNAKKRICKELIKEQPEKALKVSEYFINDEDFFIMACRNALLSGKMKEEAQKNYTTKYYLKLKNKQKKYSDLIEEYNEKIKTDETEEI